MVPYLGTYLTVLMMLDTALPDTVEVSRRPNDMLRRGWMARLYLNVTQMFSSLQGGLINFEKHRRVGVTDRGFFLVFLRSCLFSLCFDLLVGVFRLFFFLFLTGV